MKLSDFRSLIPSWLFFDDASAGCQVYYRVTSTPNDWREWTLAFPKSERKLRHLILNPGENLRLYLLGNFNRLLHEAQGAIDHPETILKSESYQLCCQLLLVTNKIDSGQFCQFKIQSRLEGDASGTFQDAFLSEVYKIP